MLPGSCQPHNKGLEATLTLIEPLEHRLRAEARVCQHLLAVIAQVGLHRRQQHGQAVVVGGVVAEFGRHHDLHCLVHRRLRVVPVVIATTGVLHVAAVGIGEATPGRCPWEH